MPWAKEIERGMSRRVTVLVGFWKRMASSRMDGESIAQLISSKAPLETVIVPDDTECL